MGGICWAARICLHVELVGGASGQVIDQHFAEQVPERIAIEVDVGVDVHPSAARVGGKADLQVAFAGVAPLEAALAEAMEPGRRGRELRGVAAESAISAASAFR